MYSSSVEHNYNCKSSILNREHEELRKWSAVSSILSSSASIVGCLLIILTYWCWRDLRTTSRTILLCIAIADLTTALGYVFGSSTYLHCEFYGISRYHCNIDKSGLGMSSKCRSTYADMCRWQSFVTTWSSVCSFFWTTILAFYLYMTIVHKLYKLVRKMMPLFHVLSWGVSLALCITAIVEKWFGPSVDDTSVSWCFVGDKTYIEGYNTTKLMYTVGSQRMLQLVMGKGWEMTCYILIVGFYLATKVYIELEVSTIVKS